MKKVVNSAAAASSTKKDGQQFKKSHVAMCRNVFKEFSDADFYGSKATHIYFYNRVDEKAVHEFRKELYEAQRPKAANTNVKSKPKPIVVHIHSPGGDGHLGITMANFLRESAVPVAVVVDGYACSAITPLFVSSVYRVVHEFSFVLLHEGSIGFGDSNVKFGKASFLVNKVIGGLEGEYKKIYTSNSKIPKDVMDDLLQRDLYMNASTCMKYKMADRMIGINKEKGMAMWREYVAKNPDYNVPADPLRWSAGLNHLYNYNNSVVDIKTGDEVLQAILSAVKPMQAVMQDASGASPRPVVLHTNMYSTPYQSRWFDIAPLLIRAFLIPTPVIGVIDSDIDLLQALPCILAHKRYMYSNTNLYVMLTHYHSANNIYYHDIKANTDMLRTTLKQILTKYTRFPQERLDKLFEDRVMLSAKECKEYGFVDDIIEPFTREEHGHEGHEREGENAAAGRHEGGKAKRKTKAAPRGKRGGARQLVQGGGCSCSQGLPIDYIDH